ncbi:MAG: hypothetical protein AAGE94_06875, partial [Acidobacteriota bacterium]
MLKRSRSLFGVFLTLGLFLLVPTPMLGCMQMDCSGCECGVCTFYGPTIVCDCDEGDDFLVPEGPRTQIKILDANRVHLIVQGYETTQLNPFTSCVTAFPPLGTVASVDSVVNYDGRDDQPFEEVSFYRSEVPDSVIARFALEEGVTTNDEPWYSFQSHITGTVEDGVPNYFVVELTLTEGATPQAFVDELKLSGQFLTSGSDEAGT